MLGPVGNPEDRFSRVNNVKYYLKSRFSNDAKLSLTAPKALDYGGLLVPFRLFVISQRKNATRKDEKTK